MMIPPRVLAVSYTHLADDLGPGLGGTVVVGMQTLEAALPGSYTHLDVYKRQVLGRVVDDRRLGVQLRLAQVSLMAGYGDHGQAHQHDQDGDRDEDFGQRKAGIILF